MVIADGVTLRVHDLATGKELRRVAEVAAIAQDKAAPADLRGEAVRTLGRLRSADSVSALTKLLPGTDDQQPNAVAALGTLAGGQPKDPVTGAALGQLQSIVTGQWVPSLRRAAVEALAGTRCGRRRCTRHWASPAGASCTSEPAGRW